MLIRAQALQVPVLQSRRRLGIFACRVKCLDNLPTVKSVRSARPALASLKTLFQATTRERLGLGCPENRFIKNGADVSIRAICPCQRGLLRQSKNSQYTA